MASEKRDWLKLSVKYSDNEWFFKWWGTGNSGYVTSLLHAGRYTEAEAKSEESGSYGAVKAVKLDWVCDCYAPVIAIRNEHKIREHIEQQATSGN